ncbi:CDP-diacylglycerol--glycerol-3-phosphate 3-phosphatidyltransferase [Salinisphaera sp. USBA-960]|uniref:CDP-diacylglycerol--glycerol-3-phosphate 3-phosphatidyltransferase n=1 Tax=Salinisphaera orenii TaxID=856731 RepID=UPI000DBE4C52|nr:CDP-diacylglycerol--glycerol-3-phosphate 3-phosphatidyltransferase [Salifodinibacter halophilus]NNC25924.1 CDP-diacylglycerol--glycerol-3-phosphate 3-phosphatidyltransferase [Salifodinibacter halophilus]
MNLPTWLTLFRLALIPFVVCLIFVPANGYSEAAAALFGIALVTDWLDGHLARRWNQASAFGAFLDPVADKLVVCAVLVMLVYRDPHYYVALPATIIVGRELTISALREWMAELGNRGIVSVGPIGKYKTVVQMIAIFIMLFNLQDGGGWYVAGTILLAISAVLTLISMVNYLRQAWPHLTSG